MGWKLLKAWCRIIFIIPLAIYAIGTPLMLLAHGDIYLRADGWLPYEVVGLFISLIMVVVSPWDWLLSEPPKN